MIDIVAMASEIKKMKQGMSYSCKEKTIILNVFKYFKTQLPEKSITDLVRRTANATGCSEKSIFQFRKEEASAEGFRAPSKTKTRKNININSRDIKYDDSVRQIIRNIVYELKYKNIIPSLNTILKNLRLNNDLPNFSLMTLRRLLFDMGFSYEKIGNKSILIEKNQRQQESSKKVEEKSFSSCHPKEVKDVIVRENNSINSHASKQTNSVNNNLSTSVNIFSKQTPQQPVTHISNTFNPHLDNLSQSLEYQNHQLLQSIQCSSPSDSHSVVGSSMHPQASLPHNVPMMLIYRRTQTHPSFISPPPPPLSDMHYPR